MFLYKIKEFLRNHNDINSYVMIQQIMHPLIKLTTNMEDDESEEFLELYDHVIEKIAWDNISKILGKHKSEN
ncbi:hypothetical protein ACMZ6Z_00135 [Streptococcus pluranimalium]|uniref:Uncharacterized protein n=1 Tax=Helcococcus bovis TaxID=3153252 RepID=A0ABW9F831_9FIRM|nr:hypothetical protein [Streptococcus agalactiae]KAF1268418.1 hypothetical protein B8V77_04350 [Streptococcus agalactiae]RRA51989.1 hypothetical protein D5F80_10535 [Streptococcus agalactiae]